MLVHLALSREGRQEGGRPEEKARGRETLIEGDKHGGREGGRDGGREEGREWNQTFMLHPRSRHQFLYIFCLLLKFSLHLHCLKWSDPQQRTLVLNHV